MDEITPLLQLPTGVARDALNFECSLLGGYARIAGYERYDGHAAPSSKTYTLVYVNAFSTTPVVGNTITGFSSGATGYVLYVGSNFIVCSEVTGSFAIGETIKVGASTVGTSITAPASITALEVATYTGLAADRQRTHIAAVPGSGSILGVFVYNDVVYAFRNNAGGTAAALYKSSASGWTLVPYLDEVSFTAGTTAPAEGETITQGGVTATVKRVVLESGAWTGSAAGRFIISAPSGGSFSAGAATTATSTFTLSGAESAITMLPGGRFETVIGNFSGAQTTTRVYGCDGVNYGFEFDGTILVQLHTTTVPDTPKHICIHKNYAVWAILSSIVLSAPGLPYDYTALSGAGAVACGGTVTNLIELPGDQSSPALGVYTRNNTYILYGVGFSGSNTFTLVPLNTGAGALHYTSQNMSKTYVFDDRGVIDMQTTLNYGNFLVDTITFKVNKFIPLKRALTVGSALNRSKSQYRLFFSDGYGLYITNGQASNAYLQSSIIGGSMPVYFPNPVTCIIEEKLSTGDEVTYFGSNNGFVYQLDMGTSFDGLAISAHITLGYNTTNSPRVLKRYRHAQLGVSSTAYCQFDFGYSFSYGDYTILQPSFATYNSNLSSTYWDAFIWDSFYWDGVASNPPEIEMNGTSECVAISINSNSAIFRQFSIDNAILHYTPRRNKR